MISEVLSSGGVEFIFLFFGVQRSTIIVRRGALLTYDAKTLGLESHGTYCVFFYSASPLLVEFVPRER